MANANRDGNKVPVLMGSYNGTPVPLKADHTTGYLKVKVVAASLTPPTVNDSVAPRDDNQVTAWLGTNSGTPKTLKADHTTKYLRVIFN